MKKILVVAPALSRSGYGEQARFALRALANEPERFDIYLQIINWGATPFLHQETEEYLWIKSLAVKTEQYARGGGQFDVSLQITIPNEWKRYAPVNIGYTAGIECNFISPKWYEPSTQMDKIIVPSEHAKSGFINTEFNTQDGKKLKVNVPVEVVPFPAKIVDIEEFGFNPTTSKNFLSVCQWGPRKNVEAVLEAFYQEFKRESDVGLVLKINVASDCEIDRSEVRKRLNQFKERHSDAKCKVYMIHGDLSEGQLKSLYTHPTIKGYVTATHGEGFGLPIFEAAINELPVIAADWSAYMDFMTLDGKPAFLTVKYQIGPVGDESVWEGVIEKGTSWCYPVLNSLKARMRELLDTDYTRFKSRAKKLSAKILETHKQEDLLLNFVDSLGLFSKKRNNLITPIDGISFCIPTNGKKQDKTKMTINSIKKQKWGNIPYEIVICGNIEPFKDIKDLKLVEDTQSCFSRKVSSLRNKAADNSKYSTIVFCDDDIILDNNWAEQTLKYSNEKYWDVLSNKILSPDGTRYWDRAILNPHIMVDYDHTEDDKNLYQTSCFFMIRKNVFERVRWDETKLVYADRIEGGIPEDVQYSIDLIKNDYKLSFNKNSLVWHFDETYTEMTFNGIAVCMKKEIIKEKTGRDYFLDKSEEFESFMETFNE